MLPSGATAPVGPIVGNLICILEDLCYFTKTSDPQVCNKCPPSVQQMSSMCSKSLQRVCNMGLNNVQQVAKRQPTSIHNVYNKYPTSMQQLDKCPIRLQQVSKKSPTNCQTISNKCLRNPPASPSVDRVRLAKQTCLSKRTGSALK